MARLYGESSFRRALAEQFESWRRLDVHLAPPALGTRKRRFGPWMLALMGPLARLKGLRGTPFDPFGHTAERRRDRALLAGFEATLDELAQALSPANHAQAVAIAHLPLAMRGFGPVKDKAVAEALTEQRRRLAAFHDTNKAKLSGTLF